ncbi:hypothetical protein AALP_AAs65556U000100 [Arabis alpina]|uniref:Uncharacterized protein n=1 Tax=Arabis alpina TaxID=50452 RepID=A0A087G154_ARAAL|nr:hypothetical protein AALP_AAs65556U000100 [Arabis alpina]
MAVAKGGASRGRGRSTSDGGGRGSGGGGSHTRSKAEGKLPSSGGGSPPLSKAQGKLPASGGGSGTPLKPQMKQLASGGGNKRVAVGQVQSSGGEHNHNDKGSPTRNGKSTGGQTSSINSNLPPLNTPLSQGTPPSLDTRFISKTRVSYSICSYNSQPESKSPTNSEGVEMEDREDEDEEEEIEGDDEKVEHVEGLEDVVDDEAA